MKLEATYALALDLKRGLWDERNTVGRIILLPVWLLLQTSVAIMLLIELTAALTKRR